MARQWIVTGTSMVVEADTEEEAIARAEESSGWHWEAEEVTETHDHAADLTAYVRRGMVLGLVAREIICPYTGQVLDVRNCVVLNDADGDPAFVLSQEGWASLHQFQRDLLAKTHGLTVDPTTVQTQEVTR